MDSGETIIRDDLGRMDGVNGGCITWIPASFWGFSGVRSDKQCTKKLMLALLLNPQTKKKLLFQ